MLKAIPNSLTLANLVCGCLGIACAFQQSLEWSGYFIGIAAVFDFLDGFTARLLNAKSEIGKQLDSLADMVTFGVLPGVILFQLLSISFGEYFTPILSRPISHILWASIAFLVPCFAALRLAKFNIDETQSDTFVGMPTPSIAIFTGALPIILNSLAFNFYHPLVGKLLGTTANLKHWSKLDFYTVGTIQDTWFLTIIILVVSGLMVVPVRMIALKFKGFSIANNRSIFGFLLVTVILGLITVMPYIYYIKGFPTLDFLAIPLLIICYPIYSVATNIFTKP